MPASAAFWAEDAPASLSAPATASLPQRIPFAVIGAGISGAWCALELARRGHDVLLLDAEQPGAGATGRNAGFLLAESDCFGLAESVHGEAVARAIRDAGLRTRELVRDLVGNHPRSIGLSWTGSVRLSEDDTETQAFERSVAAGRSGVRGTPVARVREAGLSGRYTAALLDEGDGILHPLRLLGRVLDAARDAGVRVHPGTPVLGVQPVRGCVELQTPAGDVRAEQVVVATSAAARRLLPDARPIRPVRAQALVATVTPDPGWRRPVYATHGGDYWRPLGRGRVLLGGLRRLRRRQENTARPTPSAELQTALDALLHELVGPDAAIDVTHRWAGTMAFTPSGLPWVGSIPHRRQIACLAGMNGHGMGCAPALAEGLAAHLTGEGPPPLPAFRPKE